MKSIKDVIADFIRQRLEQKKQDCRRLQWDIAMLQADVNRAKHLKETEEMTDSVRDNSTVYKKT